MAKKKVTKKKTVKKKAVLPAKTRIAILLDSSGSMQHIRNDAIDLYNDQIKEIKKFSSDSDIRVTLVTFDEHVYFNQWNRPIDDLEYLSEENYHPCSCTALYDAVGETVQGYINTSEFADENCSFLVVIITDGEDNKSSTYNEHGVSNLIKTLQATGRWTFTYLGANQDVKKVAQTMNIPVANTSSFVPTSRGLGTASNQTVSAVNSYLTCRTKGSLMTESFYSNSQIKGK